MDQVPLCKEVDLGPGHIVLDGDPVGTQHPPTAAPPHFSAHAYCGQTVAHLSNCWALVVVGQQNADIADTLQLRNVAMATIFVFLYIGCTFGATWRIRLNRPCDAALCQITLTTCSYCY